MQGEIAGDPELIEPMDGSAGNRSPSCQAELLEGHRGPWLVGDRSRKIDVNREVGLTKSRSNLETSSQQPRQ